MERKKEHNMEEEQGKKIELVRPFEIVHKVKPHPESPFVQYLPFREIRKMYDAGILNSYSTVDINFNDHEVTQHVFNPVVKSQQEQKKIEDRKGGYFVNDEGDTCYLNNKGEIRRICNFTIKITEILEVDHHNRKEYKYSIVLKTSRPSSTYRFKITEDDFIRSEWIGRNTNNSAIFYPEASKPYDHLKVIISKQMPSCKKRVQINYIGWEPGKSYLYSGGQIGGTTEIECIKTGFDLLINDRLDEISAIRNIFDMCKVFKQEVLGTLLIAQNILGLLKTPFEDAGHTPRTLLMLHGKTNTFKTSVALLFFQVFGRDNLKVKCSFKDTAASMEVKIFDNKDSTLPIDDYHPTVSAYEMKAMETKAQTMIRLYGDNVGKSRMNNRMQELPTYPPKGLAVFTGENNFSIESSLSRIIEVELRPGDVNTEYLSKHQQSAIDYSTFIYYFLEWFSNNYDKCVDYISSNVKVERNRLSEFTPYPRISEERAKLIVAYRLFLSFCEEYSVVNSVMSCRLVDEFYEYIVSDLTKYQKRLDYSNPVTMYLVALRDELITGKVKVINIEDHSKIKPSGFIGYENDDYYFLMSTLIVDAVRDYWKSREMDFVTGPRKILEALDDANLLEKNDGSKRTGHITKWIKDDQKRYVWIRKAVMDVKLKDVD